MRLAGAGCEQVFQERQSGKDEDRPELETCLKVLRKGDTLIVWRLDRLGRSLKDLVDIVNAPGGSEHWIPIADREH